MDSEGNLWVADLQMDRLLKFTSQGGFEPQPTLVITPATDVLPAAQLLDPLGLAFDDQGTLWVSNFGQDSLVGYTADQLTGSGEQAVAPAFLLQRTGANSATLSDPNGLAFSVDGNLWVANRANDTLIAYSPDQLAAATLDMSVSNSNRPVPISTITDAGRRGTLDSPIGLAFQADGDLWVSNRGALNILVEFDKAEIIAGGNVAAKTTVAVPAPAPAALAFDYQGDLWVLKTQGDAVENRLLVELHKDQLENGTAAVRDRFSDFGDTNLATNISFNPPPADLPLAH